MVPIGAIAFIAFWAVAIRLWIIDGPKIPLVFIVLWVIGLFGFPYLGWPRYVFLSFEAILAAVLLIIERYKSAL